MTSYRNLNSEQSCTEHADTQHVQKNRKWKCLKLIQHKLPTSKMTEYTFNCTVDWLFKDFLNIFEVCID